MSKSKLTLLIDGNWLLMSRLSVIANQYNDDYELSHELQLLLIRSIKLVLKHFPDIDNIIFVCLEGLALAAGLTFFFFADFPFITLVLGLFD